MMNGSGMGEWMGGWAGGWMWFWPTIGVLVVALLAVSEYLEDVEQEDIGLLAAAQR